MAALLHDIGHYPLSHITERVVLKEAKSIPPPSKLIVTEQESISEEKFDHPLHKLNLDLHPTRNPGMDYAHHERMGNLVIQKTEIMRILKGHFKNRDISRIQRLIPGIEPSPEKDIIHSELDADKFDYLTRDSHQTGVTYGVFDVEQIIRHLELSDEGELVAGEKSKRAVEHYLMSKYFLYSQVIHHKTVASFNLMAQEIYGGLLERGIAWSYKDLLERFDDDCQPSYLIYDDEYFFDLMRGVEKGKIKLPRNEGYSLEDDKLRTFIHMVLNRQRLKMVDNQQELSEKKNTRKIKEFSAPVIASLCKEAYIEPYWFIVDEISVSPTKINPYRSGSDDQDGSENEAIKVVTMEYDKDGSEKKKSNFLICDKSSIIGPLSLYQLNISRVYTKNESYEQKLTRAIKNHRMNS